MAIVRLYSLEISVSSRWAVPIPSCAFGSFSGIELRKDICSVLMASLVLFLKQARCLGCQLVTTEARWDVLFVRGRLEIDLRSVSGLRASYGRQITVVFGVNT